MTIRYNEMVLS